MPGNAMKSMKKHASYTSILWGKQGEEGKWEWKYVPSCVTESSSVSSLFGVQEKIEYVHFGWEFHRVNGVVVWMIG